MNKKILKYSLVHAFLATAYIFCVAVFVFCADKIIKIDNVPFFGPVIVLLLLVLSAAIMGILIFGKPVLLYLDNQKKDALTLLFSTVGWLAAILFIVILFVLILF